MTKIVTYLGQRVPPNDKVVYIERLLVQDELVVDKFFTWDVGVTVGQIEKC